MVEITELRREIVEMLREGEYLVAASIHCGDQVQVTIDAYDGLPISRCIEVSRAIEALHDRDVEDYALEVSTPSLSDPWVVYEQYQKYLTKPVQVVEKGGSKWTGILTEVGPQREDLLPAYVVVEIEKVEIVMVGAKKKKTKVKEQLRIAQDDLKRISYDIDQLL